jgi:hypothetical protein
MALFSKLWLSPAAIRFPTFRIFWRFRTSCKHGSVSFGMSASLCAWRNTEQIDFQEICRHVPFPLDRTGRTMYEHINAFLLTFASLMALHMVFIATGMFRTKDGENKHSFYVHYILSVSNSQDQLWTHRWQRLHGAFEKMDLDPAQHKPSLRLRYVGDTFVVWPQGLEPLQNFLSHLNTLRPPST